MTGSTSLGSSVTSSGSSGARSADTRRCGCAGRGSPLRPLRGRVVRRADRRFPPEPGATSGVASSGAIAGREDAACSASRRENGEPSVAKAAGRPAGVTGSASEGVVGRSRSGSSRSLASHRLPTPRLRGIAEGWAPLRGSARSMRADRVAGRWRPAPVRVPGPSPPPDATTSEDVRRGRWRRRGP